jgi:hypothetical protein
MSTNKRTQRRGRPLDFLGGFMGDDERMFVVCSNSSSVNSKSGSGWREKRRLQARGLPASDGSPTVADIRHLPITTFSQSLKLGKYLSPTRRGVNFMGIFGGMDYAAQ